MSQLGYTWYPQDWWTSETFKRLKRFPIVRYTIRELFDLMYKEGKPVEMNREFLFDDFNIVLTDIEYEKLLEFITIGDDGKWWIESIRRRLSKAETARANGKKGGRPNGSKKDKSKDLEETQKPREKTQQENPNNPPLEIESKIESKVDNIYMPDEVIKNEEILTESEFIEIWKRARLHYDNQKCGFDKLLQFERQSFNSLLNDFSKKEFGYAVAGLFFQETLPTVRVRPKWLLERENFEKMLDCWLNQNKIFAKSKSQENQKAGKFQKGDV